MYLAVLLGWSEKVSYEGAALHNWYLPRMFRQFIWRHSRYRPTPSPDVEASLVLGMAYATLLRTLFTSRPAGVHCFDPLQTGRTFRSSPHSRLPSYCVPCRVLSRATCSVTGDAAVLWTVASVALHALIGYHIVPASPLFAERPTSSSSGREWSSDEADVMSRCRRSGGAAHSH